MFVRQGSFEVIPGKLDELRQIYYRECAPIVRASPGNIDVYLLEPTEQSPTRPAGRRKKSSPR